MGMQPNQTRERQVQFFCCVHLRKSVAQLFGSSCQSLSCNLHVKEEALRDAGTAEESGVNAV